MFTDRVRGGISATFEKGFGQTRKAWQKTLTGVKRSTLFIHWPSKKSLTPKFDMTCIDNGVELFFFINDDEA
jgi:hypothetical protein